MPFFSIIVPVYNSAETLGRALQSVMEQSFKDWELILVDDGSSDDLTSVLNSFSAHNISIVTQENLGVSSARNRGVSMAKGEWLTFLDADDYYYEHRLAMAYELIQHHPEIGFVTGDYEYRNPEGELLGLSMNSTESGRYWLNQAKGADTVVMAAQHYTGFIEQHFGDMHTLTVRKKTFEELGGFSTDYRVAEDIHLLYRLCDLSDSIGVICKPLAVYQIFPNSATRSHPLAAQQQSVKALRNLLSYPFSKPVVKKGVRQRLRRARLDLAYVCLRQGNGVKAIASMLPLLLEKPSFASVRDILSITRSSWTCGH